MKILSLILILFFISSINLDAIAPRPVELKSYEIFAGLNFKKYNGLYWENGINSRLYYKKLGLTVGAIYETTLLGSAINSNALKQHSFSTFIDKDINIYNEIIFLNPRLNIGYFYVNYESAVFKELDNDTFTISPELVLRVFKAYNPMDNFFNFELTMGYNLIHGNGQNGIGSLYPIYFRFNILYQLTKNKGWVGCTDFGLE